jgi:hypothetical protein
MARRINWKRTRDARYPFESTFERKKCVIRLNEFPDEHMYTLLVDGRELMSFDDWSPNWNRPGREEHRKAAQAKQLGFRSRQRSSKVA